MAKYFKDAEFKRCTPSCSIADMDAAFLNTLDAIRETAGIPLVISCAYRSKAYDKAKGRSGDSAHTRGKAVDVVANSSQTRMKLVAAALACGVRRIGIGANFVHIDTDGSLPQDVLWHYYN